MDADTTLTPFLRGRIRVHQPERGYRFNIDSVVLAGFAWAREGERLLDLGAGTGILCLLLAHRHHLSSFTAVEIQPELAALAERNVEENGWTGTGRVVAGDLRSPDAVSSGAFDLVVCNPPYYHPGRGQAAANPQRALSRQGFSAEPADVLAAASRALAPGGRFCLVWPAPRLAELLASLPPAGLHPRLLRHVHDSAGSPPHLTLLQTTPAEGRGCLTLPPVVLRGSDHAFTPEVARWLGEVEPEGPRVFCDVMVGRLARYLRLTGVDAAYWRGAEDAWLVTECQRSGRTLLTRDRPLLARAARAGLDARDPASDSAAEQLAWFRAGFPSAAPGARPRCLACNAPTMTVEREEARGKVPPYTALTHRQFSACPCCGKLTWEGSHLERFKKTVMGG